MLTLQHGRSVIIRRADFGRFGLRLVAYLLAAAGCFYLAEGLWIPVKAELAQYLLNRSWDAARSGEQRARPWPWAEKWPVARLELRERDITWIILSGASGRNLAFAPGHMDGSARPGDSGVSVIAGHRDTHFRVLEEFEIGDRLVVELADGSRYIYTVFAIDIVDAEHTSLRLDSNIRTLVLVTCYPFDALAPGGSLRYVVTAHVTQYINRYVSAALPL